MTYEERADHIATLLQDQLGIRGAGLETKLHNAGRLLPVDIRRHAQSLVGAVKLEGNPKLARMIDEGSTRRSYEICQQYLEEVDVSARRKGKFLDLLTINAFNLIVISVVLVAVLRWRGFL
ncbi:MAG: hypothetical protein V3V25_13790 [Paracoccaceae bacterium]